MLDDQKNAIFLLFVFVCPKDAVVASNVPQFVGVHFVPVQRQLGLQLGLHVSLRSCVFGDSLITGYIGCSRSEDRYLVYGATFIS